MAVEIIPFKAEHIASITPQLGAGSEGEELLKEEHYRAVERQHKSFTIVIDRRIIACCGIVKYWPGRGEAWAVIDRNCKRQFLLIFRVCKRLLEMSDLDRIEATINKNFDAGHRWIKLLGFELEAPLMRKYGVTGKDFSLYARVK